LKRKYFFHIFLFLIFLYAFSFSYADGGKRLNLILKDGKVSADVHKVPLKEVIQEIGRKCGILVEVYGKVEQASLNYDPTLLANPRVTIGDSGKQAEKKVIFNEISPGLLRVGVVGLNQKAIPDGVTAYVTFDILKDGQILLGNEPTATGPHGDIVPVIIRDGKITPGK
jgi:hypothetical protein